MDVDTALRAQLAGKRTNEEDEPIAYKTVWGWVIAGNTNDYQSVAKRQVHVTTQPQAMDMLEKFWVQEELPKKQHLTREQAECERIFQETTTRAEDGRFVVKIPFRNDPPVLGPSRQTAVRRWRGAEHRLAKNPELQEQYHKVWEDHIQQGHMELVPKPDPKEDEATYLPHHPVVRKEAVTTKTRIVLDASCKTDN